MACRKTATCWDQNQLLLEVRYCGAEYRQALPRGPEDPSVVFTVIHSTGVRANLRDNYKCAPRGCELSETAEHPVGAE